MPRPPHKDRCMQSQSRVIGLFPQNCGSGLSGGQGVCEFRRHRQRKVAFTGCRRIRWAVDQNLSVTDALGADHLRNLANGRGHLLTSFLHQR